MPSIKKNFIYNVLYQILVLILPLITVPYVSRILGTDGVGIYSYTYSIVYYFMLIAMLGINNYGNRTIAKVRNDKNELSKTFIGIYLIQLVMSLLMILIYLCYILFININYRLITIIQLIYLISCVFDINWFFFGMENFKITVTRNIIVKITSLILILLIVKSKDDLWIYTLIMSSSMLFSQLLLLPFLLKEIKIIKISFSDVKKHIKPCLILFIPVIAISLYKIMDKIMLGLISNVNEVGLYEQAEKITSLPVGLITALGTVMLPRISNLVYRGEEEKIKKYISKSVKFMMFLAFPICFGLVGISSDFVPLFLGKEFVKSSILIYYLSVIIIFLSFANVIRTQYLIPKEKDKIYIISVIGGAVVNLVVNLILIPNLNSIGACIGTILAEFFVMFYQSISVRREIPIKDYLKDIFPFFIKSIIMFAIIMIIKIFDINQLLRVLIQVMVGGLIYVLLNTKYIFSIINIKKVPIIGKLCR